MSSVSVVPAGNDVSLIVTANAAGLIAGAEGVDTVAQRGTDASAILAPLNVASMVCAGTAASPGLAVNASSAGVTSTARSDAATLYDTGRSKVSSPAPFWWLIKSRTVVDLGP